MKAPVKEFWPSELNEGQTYFIIRLSHYGSRLNLFLELFQQAKQDFPGLEMKNVEVVKYGGKRISGTFGIEFALDGIEAPEGYKQIGAMEFAR